MAKKKILMTNIKDQAQKGGLGFYVNDIFLLSKKNGLLLDVLMPQENLKGYSIDANQVIDTKKFDSRLLKWLYHLVVLPVKCRKYDIVHYSSEDLPIITHRIFNTLTLSKQTIIMTIHDLGEYETKRYSKFKDFLRRIMIPLEAKMANKIFTVSESTKVKIVELLKVKEDKIHVVYSPIVSKIDIPDKRSSEVSVDKKFGVNKEYFLYVSQINHPSKNHCRLIDAFEKVRDNQVDIQLVLAGTGGYNAEAVFQRIDSSRHKNDIKYLGYVEEDDLSHLFNACSVYVFPSLYEGYGRGILEAWIYSKPLIVSNIPTMMELAKDAAIVVDPESVDSIATAIIQMQESDALKEDYVKRGRDRLDLFSHEKIFEQLIEGYEI